MKEYATEIDHVIERMQTLLEAMRNQDPSFYAKHPMHLHDEADEEVMKAVTDQWRLPDEYAYFLKHYVPQSVGWSTDDYIHLDIYGAHELIEGQLGYNYNPVTAEAISEWPENFLVIATDEGDPYCIDLSRGDTAVYSAEHGTGSWDFDIAYDDLIAFLQSVLIPRGFEDLGLDEDATAYEYYNVWITGEGQDRVKTLLFIKRVFSCDVAQARAHLESAPLLVYRGIAQGAVNIEAELLRIGANYDKRQISLDEFLQRL